MSVFIQIMCDRCKTVADCPSPGRVRSFHPHISGWRYLSANTNLCPRCSEAFEVWRTTSIGEQAAA